jgi:putative inorganic carbon (hco3(-)) transporter
MTQIGTKQARALRAGVSSESAFSEKRDDGVMLAAVATEWMLRPLQALASMPSLLFLTALAAMLLRHPDVAFYEIDRIAFGLLLIGVLARLVVTRERLFVIERATWPMLGLILLALASVLSQPFDHETWSLLAAKFFVPFTMFHLSNLIFTEERKFRQFEIFAIIVLAYLSFTAIAFLVGARSLIFPQFILDESLGFHADRARGPLLQAVANGVSLNMLGVLALHAYRRGSVRGVKMWLLLASVPVAILATMTRAVWLTFIGTIVALIFVSENRRISKSSVLRFACVALTLLVGIVFAMVMSSGELGSALSERLEERGPLDYREAVYAGGWEMFLQRPLTGWGFHQMPAELPRHVSGYREKTLYPHNTYLELLVELGAAGLVLYMWLMWELWQLGRSAVPKGERNGFLDAKFHHLWPILLGVYWINAAMVVMSYQFVNGLLFTMAGMLAAQGRRAKAELC